MCRWICWIFTSPLCCSLNICVLVSIGKKYVLHATILKLCAQAAEWLKGSDDDNKSHFLSIIAVILKTRSSCHDSLLYSSLIPNIIHYHWLSCCWSDVPRLLMIVCRNQSRNFLAQPTIFVFIFRPYFHYHHLSPSLSSKYSSKFPLSSSPDDRISFAAAILHWAHLLQTHWPKNYYALSSFRSNGKKAIISYHVEF